MVVWITRSWARWLNRLDISATFSALVRLPETGERAPEAVVVGDQQVQAVHRDAPPRSVVVTKRATQKRPDAMRLASLRDVARPHRFGRPDDLRREGLHPRHHRGLPRHRRGRRGGRRRQQRRARHPRAGGRHRRPGGARAPPGLRLRHPAGPGRGHRRPHRAVRARRHVHARRHLQAARLQRRLRRGLRHPHHPGAAVAGRQHGVLPQVGQLGAGQGDRGPVQHQPPERRRLHLPAAAAGGVGAGAGPVPRRLGALRARADAALPHVRAADGGGAGELPPPGGRVVGDGRLREGLPPGPAHGRLHRRLPAAHARPQAAGGLEDRPTTRRRRRTVGDGRRRERTARTAAATTCSEAGSSA